MFAVSLAVVSPVHLRAAADGGADEEFKKLLLTEFREHPDAAIQDFYKFIHQSSMGPGHWKMDFAMAQEYLKEETRSLRPDSSQMLFQFLSPDSELVRVNLRPYIALHGDLDSLAAAFVRTSHEYIRSESTLENYLSLFSHAVKERTIPLNYDSVRSFIHRMRKDNFPAVHHSKQYEEKYLPSYRVVLRKYLPVNLYHATRKN